MYSTRNGKILKDAKTHSHEKYLIEIFVLRKHEKFHSAWFIKAEITCIYIVHIERCPSRVGLNKQTCNMK